MNDRRSMLATISQDQIPGSAKELVSSEQTGNVLYVPFGMAVLSTSHTFIVVPASGTDPAYLLDGNNNIGYGFGKSNTRITSRVHAISTGINLNELGWGTKKIASDSSFTLQCTPDSYSNYYEVSLGIMSTSFPTEKSSYSEDWNASNSYVSRFSYPNGYADWIRYIFKNYYIKLKFDKEVRVGYIPSVSTSNYTYSYAFSGNYGISPLNPIYIGKESGYNKGFDTSVIRNMQDGVYGLTWDDIVTDQAVSDSDLQGVIVKDSQANRILLAYNKSPYYFLPSAGTKKWGSSTLSTEEGAHDGFTASYPNTSSELDIALTDMEGRKNHLANGGNWSAFAYDRFTLLGNAAVPAYIGAVGEYNLFFKYQADIQSKYSNFLSCLNYSGGYWTSTRAKAGSDYVSMWTRISGSFSTTYGTNERYLFPLFDLTSLLD